MLVLVIHEWWLFMSSGHDFTKVNVFVSQYLCFGLQVIHIYISPDYGHVIPLLRTLCWLSISFRIKSKVLTIIPTTMWFDSTLPLISYALPLTHPPQPTVLLVVCTTDTLSMPQGLCTYCSLYLTYFSPRYLHVWFPNFIHIFVQMSVYLRGLPWSSLFFYFAPFFIF